MVKEELQEKIYSLESEIKQIKFERDNKESQIIALKEQIGKRAEEKVRELIHMCHKGRFEIVLRNQISYH